MPDTAPPDLPLEIVDHGQDDPALPKKATRRRRVWMIPAVFGLIALGGIMGIYFQPPTLRAFFAVTGIEPGGGSSDPFALPADVVLPEDVAATLQPTDVVGLARLMPQGDVSTVAPPFGSGDARIDRLLVAEGDRVAQGQRLAVLDNLASLESAVAAAEATVALREASLLQTRQSVSQSLAEARASVEEAEALAAAATADLDRARSLFDRGVTTRATLDQAVAAATQADQAAARAHATLARFTSDDPDSQPDVIVARRNLDAAQIELDRARRDLDRAYVVAPISGTILDISARPGESAGQGGVMEIGDTSQMMAEVEVYQDRISEVAPGQHVELVASALQSTLYGRVDRTGLLVERQTVVSSDTAANTDARIVRVLVRLDPDSSARAERLTNLEVVARIDTRGEAAE